MMIIFHLRKEDLMQLKMLHTLITEIIRSNLILYDKVYYMIYFVHIFVVGNKE